MKVSNCALLSTVILGYANAGVENDNGVSSNKGFFKRPTDAQATFNIDRTQTQGRDGDTVYVLGDNDLVDVLIQTDKSKRGSSAVHSMSMKVNTEIESAGIIGATLNKKDIENLKRNPNILSVEEDQMFYVVGDSVGHLRKLSEETPYGIPMVLQDMDFWSNLDEPSGAIKVCVADTGYDRGHVDLPDGDDVTGTNNPDINENWYEDGHGHGTHCSGTVAGIGGNDEGVVGVIPNNAGGKFQLVIGNALTGAGWGSGAGVLKAIDTCVANGAKVVSLSLGGTTKSSITETYYKDLYEKQGILFIAAAGNGGNSAMLYPASYPALVSVAAIDSNKNKAGFSQYNNQVEISAPGVLIRSSLPDDKYASWSGTSMATPHVAGVAGLLWMHFPDCTNYEIRNVLAATAEDLKASGCDIHTGYGLVQAKNAYDMLSQGGCGGNLGQISPVGGCEQLVPVDPTPSPTTTAPVSPPPSTSAPNPAPTSPTPTSTEAPDDTFIPTSTEAPDDTFIPTSTEAPDDTFTPTSTEAPDDTFIPTSTEAPNDTFIPTSTEAPDDTFIPTTTEAPDDTFTPTSTEAPDDTFSPTSTEAPDNTFSPSNPPITQPTVTPPTPHPIGIAPTPFPTGTQPTPFPTNTPLTPWPTDSPPTPYPVNSPPTPHPVNSPPTAHPTHIPPTPFPTNFPTQTPPTPYPTQIPPTPYPTHTPPTPQPTVTPPTPHPTGIVPTPFPTETPPTPFPTDAPPSSLTGEGVSSLSTPANSCIAAGEACAKWSECCSNSCDWKKKSCRA